MNYQQELDFGVRLAKKAGAIMREYFDRDDVGTTWKEDNTPLTLADTAINQLIIEEIKAAYPEDGVMGEEASYETERSRVWVVDPIDGTQSFDLKSPTSTFCLGLTIDREPVVGIVHDPFIDNMYVAAKGAGAFLNSGRLDPSSPAKDISQQYIVLSSKLGNDHASIGAVADRIVDAGGKYFNFRSVVYGLMRVASGKAVAAVAGPSYPWDFVAASVILHEAGVHVTDLSGNEVDCFGADKGMIASLNKDVHEQIIRLLKKDT